MDRIYGNIFKALREKAHLTQAEVAKLAGLTQSGVSRLEAGSRWPTRKTLRRICVVYNISFDDFFTYLSDGIHGKATDDWLDDEGDEKKRVKLQVRTKKS